MILVVPEHDPFKVRWFVQMTDLRDSEEKTPEWDRETNFERAYDSWQARKFLPHENVFCDGYKKSGWING